MASEAGSGNPACGHPVQPGSRFCPVCGQPAIGSAAPSQPSTAQLPAAQLPAVTAPQPALPSSLSPLAAPVPQTESTPWESWYAPRWPPSRPSAPQPWPVPPDGGQPPPADPDATRLDGLGPVPPDDLPMPMLGGLRPASVPDGPRHSRRPPVLVIVAAVLMAVVAGVVIFRAHSGNTAAGRTTGTAPSNSSQDARRQAAARLSGLLAQSVTDRAAVIDAAEDVRGCGPSLHQDAQTFTRAASSRQHLLSRLASLPGRSALPPALLRNLKTAWQASAEVDTDLARWATDTLARGCHRNSRSDAGLRASFAPEGRATVGKHEFARLWNPVARGYGLTTYQPSQL
jgi:hypothetical protein